MRMRQVSLCGPPAHTLAVIANQAQTIQYN